MKHFPIASKNQVLELIFIHNQNDLKFVFKFRKISKFCKNISEYYLTEILNEKYLQNVDVKQFKKLKKLQCSLKITDDDLQHLKHLTHLELPHPEVIKRNEPYTWQEIKQSKNLITCTITDDGIKHLQLEILEVAYGSKITDAGLENMYDSLKHLHVSQNENITDNSVQHMNLHTLTVSCCYGITDKGIQHMNLYELSACYNGMISNKGIEHMTNLKILNIAGNLSIDGRGLRNIFLDELYLGEHNLTNDDIRHMNLRILGPLGNSLTAEGLAHMTNCKFLK